MSTRETESPDCQERVGLKRKLTGPPRLLLGKSKSKDKSDSQRRPRHDKCCEDTLEDINKPHHDKEGKDYSPQKEREEIETQTDAQGDTLGIIVTLEENRGREENVENKAGMTRSTNKTTIKRMFSSLLCSGRKVKESDTRHAEDRVENRNSQDTKRNKAHTDTCNSSCKNKQCDANNKNGKGKRNFFFMVWPISKKSSVASNVNQGRQCSEETPPKASFKKIYRIFPRRKKAHNPIDHIECAEGAEGDQVNQLSSINIEIPSTHKQEHRKDEREIEQSAPETFTISAEVSINTNIQSGHIDDEQEICTDQDAGKFVLSTIKEEKHPVMETTNDEFLQISGLLVTCDGSFYSELPGTSIALGDVPALNDANQERSDKKCKPVITIDRVYTPEEVDVNEEPRLDFLSMNGSWQHLKINRLTDNTLHPTDPSVSPELDHSRCNETLLIQTAISMVQAAIHGAVEQLTNEQQQNQIHLDSV